ncbi:MAG: putative fatty-acid--CoA ligase, partial [Modestobacter sp.]|nr:putative fatty-acid--CoA ligase [Modestobacter sp.]
MPEHNAANPFDSSGTEVGADGIRRYTGLQRNVVVLLREIVERFPDRTAVIELDGPSVTYAELWERAGRVAGGLRDAGVRPGDRVAVRLGNGLDWLLAFWGTHLAGGIVVPLNTRLAEA